MMFSSFTLNVTEKCNFSCSYCYQKKGTRDIEVPVVEKTLQFFFPFFADTCYINFYGGEPLLAFDKIKLAVRFIQEKNKGQKKKIYYSITSNGSLIDEEILRFLERYKFSLMVSFDGLPLEVSRDIPSCRRMVSVLKKLLASPGMDLETNSVFTPQTVGYLSKSIQFISELGIGNINLALSCISRWDNSSLLLLRKELAALRKYFLPIYKKTGAVPLVELRKNSGKGIFGCSAGKDRMVLSAEGKIWGCFLFADYFKGKEKTDEYYKYCFGDLDTFIENHTKIYPEVVSNYSNLGMSNYYTSEKFCSLCDELEGCRVCPVGAAFSTSILGKIPPWTCEIRNILKREKELFWKEAER